MAGAVISYLTSLYTLLYGLWFWLFFGFFVAALIREFVPTDLTELSMLWAKFGRRTTVAYLVVSTVLVVIFAHILNVVV